MHKNIIKITTATSLAFEESTYIAYLTNNKECVIVDPGIDPEEMLAVIAENHLMPEAILITHGHYDHIGGIPAVLENWNNCKIYASSEEAEKLVDPTQNLSSAFGIPMTVNPADVIIQDGEEFTVAGIEFQAVKIPGHSRGHLAFVVKQPQPQNIFVGDIIFDGSIGRSDFPDGNPRALVDGIKSKLFAFPDDTVLYPGHGGKTTIGKEKRSNPFLK